MTLVYLVIIGQLCRTSGYLDIPTVPAYNIKGMWGISTMFSFPMYTDDPNPNDSIFVDPKDFTMAFKYGFGRGELAISMFTPTTWVVSVCYLLKEAKESGTAWFCGVDDISYAKHISTVGAGGNDGTIEEISYYKYCNGRPWELFSTYIAMQKYLGKVANFVLGFGRGRFVGYGWRSHIFNTDFLVLGNDYKTKDHSWWAIGLFMGGSLKFPFGLEASVEMDGRDANVGLKYHFPAVTATVALCKVEYLGNFRPWSPRWTFGLEGNNRSAVSAPKVGSIECVIQDQTTKQLLPNCIVDIKEINKRYRAPAGIFGLSLPAGNYTITVTTPNYVDYLAKISVKPGVKTKLVFNMKKTEEAIQREIAAMEREKSIKTYLAQGKIYFSEGNLNEAKKAFEMVISLDPDNVEAKNYLGNIENRRNELINAYLTEARNREKANDLTKAIEFYQKVLDLDPQNTESSEAISRLKVRIAQEKKPPTTTKPKQPEKKATAEEIEVLYKKGVSYFSANNFDEALKIFNEVLALDPNHKGAKEYKKRTEARLKVLKGGE
uniref:Tetratricopeptide repeat protein n=1 Tax=candidate division WOR-3 bacterium TaxID=2052148 RepID=A0A7V3RGH2_UNCW3